jgi:hypothetical protein
MMRRFIIYTSHQIFSVSEWRRMRWMGDVAHMGEMGMHTKF